MAGAPGPATNPSAVSTYALEAIDPTTNAVSILDRLPTGKTYSAMALAGGALWASSVEGGLVRVETASGRVAGIYRAPASDHLSAASGHTLAARVDPAHGLPHQPAEVLATPERVWATPTAPS